MRSNSLHRSENKRVFLFLQGPISPYFSEVADGLADLGHGVVRINLCFGDWLFWRRGGGRNYRGGKKAWPAYLNQVLQAEGVTDIILLGEQRYYHQEAIKLARQSDIQIIVTDFGYLRPDWITLEKDGMNAGSIFPKDPEILKSIAAQVSPLETTQLYQDRFLTMATWDILYHLLSSLFSILYPGYRSHQKHHPIVVYIGTGIRLLLGRLYRAKHAIQTIDQLVEDGRAYYVFPLQMETDFQIRAYSKYKGLKEPIDEVIQSFKSHAPSISDLVVKIHPLDPGIVNWRKIVEQIASKHGVADRVKFLDGGDLGRLLRFSSGVVTINSTVGIWGLKANVPVKILADCIYNVEGLVYEGDLNSFWLSGSVAKKPVLDNFFRAISACIQIRGVFYNRPGLDNAVSQTIARLHMNRLNVPLADLPVDEKKT